MTPQLTQMINGIINTEETVRLISLHEMNKSHAEGLRGFKRLFRYMAMDRGRHSIMLQNHMLEYHHTEPVLSISFNTPANGGGFTESIKAIHDKAKEHIGTLAAAMKMAFDENESLLGEYLAEMIEDQSKENEKLYRLLQDIKRENADLNYISYELHEKYKCKEKKYFNFRG